MWIDIVFLLTAIYSLWKGWRQGFIISLFTTLAWILGITGALKLSAVFAVTLRDRFDFISPYTPVISFILIFLLIAFIVYLIGKALETFIQIIQLGFINRILGSVLRLVVFALLFSLFIWLINQAGMISPETKVESRTYSFLQSYSQYAIDLCNEYMPALKSIFYDIENFFEELAGKKTA